MAKPDYYAGPAPRGWDRRGALVAVGAAALAVAVLFYSGGSAPVVVYQLLLDGAFLLAWLLAAAGWGGLVLAPLKHLRATGDADSPRGGAHGPTSRSAVSDDPLTPGGADDRTAGDGVLYFVTVTAAGLGLMSLATLGLGLSGALGRGVAFGVVGGGLVAGAALACRRWGDVLRGDIGAPVRAWLAERAGADWLWLVVLPLLAAAAVGAFVPPGMLWTPEEPPGYDVVEYHLQIPREWHEAGRIQPLRHNVFSFFPFGVEMHYLLAMHLRGGPWAGMYLAQLMHVAHCALAVVAVYGVALSLAQRRSAAVAAALAAAAAPWVTLLAPVAYNEGGLFLYGTLAIGWALRGMNAAPRAALARFVVAGAMAGFACGVKLTGVPMLLAAVPLAAVVASPRSFKPAAAFAVVGALLFAPWALRNLAWAGNPVFPEAARLLGRAHFSQAQVERWEQAHSPRPDQRSAGARLAAFGREIATDWRFGYGLPLALGVAGAVVARRDRRARALAVLLFLLTLFWLGLTHLQGRFFVLAVPIAALLIATADWGRWRPAVVAALAALALASAAQVHGELSRRLHRTSGLAGVLGAPDLSGLNPPEVATLPPDAPLVLVGDARAFYYPRPMRALRYRTVFDVDAAEGASVVDAWKGTEATGGEYLLIDPDELKRFHRTYRGIPELPPRWKDRTGPFLIAPGRP